MSVTLTSENFGNYKGESVKKFTWTTGSGFSLSAITYGAIIQSIKVPDNRGEVKDIVLGFDDLESYVNRNVAYFGAAIGRCANRIKGGSFEIDNQRFSVAKNIGENHLHGGLVGFDKKVWLTKISGTKVTFSRLSPHAEENYPGDVIVSVSYDVTEDDNLLMVFTATTNRTTVINLTNHSYFNLAGHDSGAAGLHDHVVTINADKITETKSLLPTGRLLDVGGTPYDLRSPTKLSEPLTKGDQYFDDNFCIPQHGPKGTVAFVARVVHPPSGRYLEVHSDQPGVQFYTAGGLNPPSQAALAGKNGVGYRKHGAFCLETQNYPDAVNHANFPSPLLKPGDLYKHVVTYKFGAQKSRDPSPKASQF